MAGYLENIHLIGLSIIITHGIFDYKKYKNYLKENKVQIFIESIEVMKIIFLSRYYKVIHLSNTNNLIIS